MPEQQRLTSSTDIRGVFAARMASGNTHVVTHVRGRADGEDPRVAIVAGRKVGNAVARNRAKRRLRALVRTADIPVGLDLVVTAKAGADAVPADVLRDEVAASIAGAVRRIRAARHT